MALIKPLAAALFAATALIAISPAGAQDAAGSRMTLVVPLAPGGAMDIIVRVMAPILGQQLGRTVIVENRTGGGTVTGALSVARATPDGNTLLIAPSATVTTNVSLYKQLAYDPVKDFSPVALYAHVPFVLVANAGTNIRSLPDLVREAKANPGKLSYASTGVGTTPHLAGEMVRVATGIDIRHVPYRGSPPALNDLVGGHVQLAFADPKIVQELIESGKVHAIGASSTTRMAALPKIPTMIEAGIPGFDAVSWHMVMAPTGTPAATITRINGAIRDFVRTPAVEKQMVGMGMIPIVTPEPGELSTFLKSEIDRWSKIVQQAGIAGTL